MNITSIIIVISLAGVGVLGDYFIKLAGTGPRYVTYLPLFGGMVLYAVTAIGWFYVMKHLKLGVLSVFYSLTTVVCLSVLGAVVFKEQLSPSDVIGIILGLVSVVILVRFG